MNNVYSVGQVNRYVKNMFTQDYFLQNIYVKGEVSNCKYHSTGHIYFTLKDEGGTLKCVMFAGSRRGLAFRMKDGDKVIAGGRVDVYERDGAYQFYAKEITLEGAGALYERYLALKQELEDMGMFAQEYKQPIPEFATEWELSHLLQVLRFGILSTFPPEEILLSRVFFTRHLCREREQRPVLYVVSACWTRQAWM